MAEQLDTFDWSAHRGRAAGYDWDTLLNGEIWRVPVGEINAKPNSFRASVVKNAEKRSLKVRTALLKDDGGNVVAVVVQSHS